MKLLEFPHSHYCEKARWALDHKRISYQRVSLLPGPHRRRLRKLVSGPSVPVLIDGDRAVQGSAQIIDYLDEKIPSDPLTPQHESDRARCVELEESFDQVFGIHLRRALYFHLLPHPRYIRHSFMSRSSLMDQALFALAFPFLSSKMAAVYGINHAEVERGLAEMEAALNHWDKILQPGIYLVGDRFTRADLALASMLYFAGLPSEFESPWPGPPPSEPARELLESLQKRPTLAWVAHIYRNHRVAHRQDKTKPIVL
jgi:glutathione S-transferase